MFATAVRWMIHKVNARNPHLKKMDIKPEELQTQKVLKIVREHGPLRPGDCWKHAEAAGIRSKIHMKRLLLWLRDRNLIWAKCVHSSGDKRNQHDLVFYWTPVVFPPGRCRQKIKDKKYYENLALREKGEKEKAHRKVLAARAEAKAKRLAEKEAELAKARFQFQKL